MRLLCGSVVKNPPVNTGNAGDIGSMGWKDPLEKEMITHSSIIAWRIPWTAHGVTKESKMTEHAHTGFVRPVLH